MFTFDFVLKESPLFNAVAICFTSSFLIPSSSNCIGSILMTPTKVDFIIVIPSVSTDTA